MTRPAIDYVQRPLVIEIGGKPVTINVFILEPKAPKKAIFLCHDLAGRGDDFLPLAPHLAAAGYKVVLWDMPGRGQSAGLEIGDYSTRTYAMVFLSLLKEHGFAKNTVLGQGWGAMLAVLYESLLKASIERLLLIDLPETWCYGRDPHAKLWASLNQIAAADKESYRKQIEACIPKDILDRNAIRDLALERARPRMGKIALWIDENIFAALEAMEDETFAPGAGLQRCRANVQLLQSSAFPSLSASHVAGIKLGMARAATWQDPSLLWPTIGAIMCDTKSNRQKRESMWR